MLRPFVALALATSLLALPSTAAAACPGGPDPCQYASVSVIGEPPPAQTDSPIGIAHDPGSGDYFVSDRYDDRVIRYGPTWQFERSYDLGDNLQPAGVELAADGASFYVAEINGNRVRQLDVATGAVLRTFGTGQGNGAGQLKFPQDLAIVGTHLWVADTGNGRLAKFLLDGSFVANVGNGLGTGVGQFGGFAGTPPFGDTFYGPGSIVAIGGDLWVTDDGNDRVQRYSGTTWSAFQAPGSIGAGLAYESLSDTLYVGAGTRLSTFDVSTTTWAGDIGAQGRAPGEFGGIAGLAVAGTSLTVADLAANQVQQWDGATWTVVLTRPTSHFEGPEGVAIDGDGNLWVVDTDLHRVVKLAPDGSVIDSFGAPYGETGTGQLEFHSPIQVAVHGSDVYVADSGNNRIQKFSTGGVFERYIGTGTCCIATPGQLVSPNGVAVDGNGVFATDTHMNKVEWFQHDGTHVDSVDTTGSGNPIGSPRGLATRQSGLSSRIYVANSSYHNILQFDATGGSFSSSTAVQGPTGNGLSNPRSVAALANGFVATDTNNDRIWINDYSTSSSFFGDSGDCIGELSFPSGIALSGQDIYVADTTNHRVQRFRGDAGGSAAGCPDLGATVTITPLTNDVSRNAGTIGFAADESVTFSCSLDGGAYSSCTTPGAGTGTSGTYAFNLGPGPRTLSVKAVDAGANETIETYAWTVYGPAPSAPLITSGPADNGTSTSSTVTFGWSFPGGGATGAECKVDASAFAPCDSLTSHAFSGLANGSHTFAIRGTDAVGPGSQTTRTVTVAVAAPLTAPTNASPPSITGTVAVGRTVTADRGSWNNSPASYAYLWQRCTTPTSGICTTVGTGDSYAVVFGDQSQALRVKVTATNAAGSSAPTPSSFTVVPLRPTNLTLPNVTGTVRVGQELATNGGSWANDGGNRTNRYSWSRCLPNGGACTGIAAGSTGSRYRITTDDVGWQLRVTVTADSPSNGLSDPITSARTETVPPVVAPSNVKVTVSGENFVGKTLTASATYAGDESQVGYQWQRCTTAGEACTAIGTGQTLTLDESMLNGRPRVAVLVLNSAGAASSEHLFNTTGREPSGRCAGLLPREDADGDKLNNFIECNVVRERGGTSVLDLPSLGADPLRKDLFIEMDWMTGHKPMQNAVNRVMEAFEKAPLPNPDGSTGIRMHIDNGPDSPTYFNSATKWGTLSGANELVHRDWVGSWDSSNNYVWDDKDGTVGNDFQSIKDTNFSSIRRFAFFYAPSIHRYAASDNASSGIARAGGTTFPEEGISSDFIVSLGTYLAGTGADWPGTEDEQAGTIMHELGHVLGLGHGGRENKAADHENYKPNFPSIMNYHWQMTGVGRVGGGFALDYSRYGQTELDTLNENSLLERVGVQGIRGAQNFRVMWACSRTVGATATTPAFPQVFVPAAVNPGGIDWDCSGGALSNAPVRADINRQNNSAGVAFVQSLTALEPRDDWGNIVFSGGAIGDAGAPAGGSAFTGGLEELLIEPTQDFTAPTTGPALDRDSTPAHLLQFRQAAVGDRTRPTITIVPAAQRKGQRTVRVKVTVRDNRRLAHYSLRQGKLKPVLVTTTKRLATRTLTLRKGRHVIVVVARDAVGNSFQRRRTIVVR